MARIRRRVIQSKDLNDPETPDGVITHLELDILECKFKWALRSISINKASAGDGISAELFQVIKNDAVKVLHSLCQQIWKTQQWPQDWKRSVFTPIPKKHNVKNAQITIQLHSSHILVKLCSEFSKPGFNSVWTKNFQTYKLDLDKAEEPEIKVPTSIGSSKKRENSRKRSISASLTTSNPLTMWITANSEKFLSRWEYQNTLPASWVICMQVKKHHLELDMEQHTGSKLGKEYVKASGQFSHSVMSVMSDSLWPHGLQQARLPCPSPTPRAYSNSHPLSQSCHPTISSSVIPSLPAFNLSQHQGNFQWVSFSHQMAKVLELQLQHQFFQCIFRADSFRVDWLDLLAVQGTLKSLL